MKKGIEAAGAVQRRANKQSRSTDQSNRRKDREGYAAWKIHPVMKLNVQ
jgi:hypothetical protein